MRFRASSLALCGIAFVLSGCATASFERPPLTYDSTSKTAGVAVTAGNALDANDVTHMRAYLQANVMVFDHLLAQAEQGKTWTEIPVIGAAALGGTLLALGESSDFPIVLAGGAAGLGALTNNIKPRERAKLAALAGDAATCVNRVYGNVITQASILGAITSSTPISDRTKASEIAKNLTAYPGLAEEIFNSGPTALAAANDITSKLKVKLADLGQVPDYGSIAADIKAKLDAAAAAAVPSTNQRALLATDPDAEFKKLLAENISKYPANIALCVAKIQ